MRYLIIITLLFSGLTTSFTQVPREVTYNPDKYENQTFEWYGTVFDIKSFANQEFSSDGKKYTCNNKVRFKVMPNGNNSSAMDMIINGMGIYWWYNGDLSDYSESDVVRIKLKIFGRLMKEPFYQILEIEKME